MSPFVPFEPRSVLAAGFGFASAALAGPPLICHPFVTDAARAAVAVGRGPRLATRRSPVTTRRSRSADTLELLSAGRADLDAHGKHAPRHDLRCGARARRAEALLGAVARAHEDAAGRYASDGARVVRRRLSRRDVSPARARLRHGMLLGQQPPSVDGADEHADLDGYALVQKALALAPRERSSTSQRR